MRLPWEALLCSFLESSLPPFPVQYSGVYHAYLRSDPRGSYVLGVEVEHERFTMRAPVEPIHPLAGFYWFKGSLEGKLKKSPGCDGEKRPWFTYLDLPPTDHASSFGFVGVVLQTKLLPLLSLQYCNTVAVELDYRWFFGDRHSGEGVISLGL
jgi:hypothetical protein